MASAFDNLGAASTKKKPPEDDGNILTNFFGDVGDFVGGLGQLGGAVIGDLYRGAAEAVTLGQYTGGQDRPQGQWNLDDVFINLTGLDPGDPERSSQTQSALVEGLKQWGNPGEYITEHPGFALLDILSLGTAAGAGAKALGTGAVKSAAARGVPSAVKALDDLAGATRRTRPGIVGKTLDELAAGGEDIGALGSLASKILPRPQSRLLASMQPGAESRLADIVEVTPSANPVARMIRQPFERFITEPIGRIEQHVAGLSEGLKAGAINPKQAPLIGALEAAVESARKAGVTTAYKPFATNQQLRWAVNKISGQTTSRGYLERDQAVKAITEAQRPIVEASLVDEAAEFYQDVHLADEVFGLQSTLPRFKTAGRKVAGEPQPGALKAVGKAAVPEGSPLPPGASQTAVGTLEAYTPVIRPLDTVRALDPLEAYDRLPSLDTPVAERVQAALTPAVDRLRQLREMPDVDPEELALTEAYVRAGLEPALLEAEVKLGRKVSPLLLSKERTRLEIIERQENRLVQYGGQTYATLMERAYRPLQVRFGMKYDEAGRRVGPSVAGLDESLRATGETAPLYFPHFDSGRPSSPMDFLMRRANVRQTANKPGTFQRSKMELFKVDRYEKDPVRALTRRVAQQTNVENTLRQIESLDEAVGRDVSPHEIIGPGEVVYAPEAINRTLRGIIKLDDDISAAVMQGMDPDAAAVGALKQIVRGNGTQMVRDLLGIEGPGAKLRVMPKVVADQLQAYTKYRFGKGVKLFWDTPTGVWKSMVLLGSPRWVVNNFLGNALFLKMQGGRFRGVIAQLDKEYRAMLRDNPQISGFLDEVTRGMFGRDFRTSEQLGTAAATATGRVYERVQKTALVRASRRLGQGTASSNALLENAYRIEAGITALERQAVPSSIQRLGRMFWSSKKRLEDLTKFKFTPQQIEAALKEAERFFGNYWQYSPFEKNVIRRFAMPFWGFYRHTLKLAATFPVEFAGRAELLRSLGEASMEFQKDLGPLPEWLKDRGFPIGMNAEGEQMFHLIGSANPLEFVGQAVSDPFRALVGSAPPGVKIPLEQGLGRSTFTGEEFTAEDVYTPFGSDQQIRIDPDTGEVIGPVEKVTPGLLEHVARQFPQYELLKDLLAGGATYDTASLPDIVGGGGVIRDEATGEPKYPDDAFERILRLLGVSTMGYDVERFQQGLAEDEQAALREALRRQVASGSAPTASGGGSAFDSLG